MPSDIRQIRNDARARLHARARILATYRSPQGANTPVGIRIHFETVNIGESREYRDAASQVATTTEIVFHFEDGVVPSRAGIVILSDAAYRVDYVFPVDGETIKAQVVRLSAAEFAAL